MKRQQWSNQKIKIRTFSGSSFLESVEGSSMNYVVIFSWLFSPLPPRSSAWFWTRPPSSPAMATWFFMNETWIWKIQNSLLYCCPPMYQASSTQSTIEFFPKLKAKCNFFYEHANIVPSINNLTSGIRQRIYWIILVLKYFKQFFQSVFRNVFNTGSKFSS